MMLDINRFSASLRTVSPERCDSLTALRAVSGLGGAWRQRLAQGLQAQGWQPWTFVEESSEPSGCAGS